MYISACAYVLKVRGKVKKEKMGARAYERDHCVMYLLMLGFLAAKSSSSRIYNLVMSVIAKVQN